MSTRVILEGTLASHRFCSVRTTVASEKELLELGAYELLAQGRNAVYEHCALKVVKLVLHDTGKITLHPFVVLVEIGIHISYMDARGTCHALVNAWQGETTLLHRLLLRVVIIFDDVGIDKCLLKTFVFWKVVTQHAEIYDTTRMSLPI